VDIIVRRIALWITVIVAIFALYITIDCIRLGSADDFTEPFVCISEEVTDKGVTYGGLGYEVLYRTDGIDAEKCYGAEFWLFDNFLIWGWIE